MSRTFTAKLLTLAATLILAIPAIAIADSQPQARDLTQAFLDGGVAVDRLQVVEIGGIVVIRGRTADKAAAEQAGVLAASLGYSRVANLVQIAAPADDARIQRAAERELTLHRSLDGCRFRVKSEGGVVHIAGNVQHELQKDMAVHLLRNIDGVREVRSDLQR